MRDVYDYAKYYIKMVLTVCRTHLILENSIKKWDNRNRIS